MTMNENVTTLNYGSRKYAPSVYKAVAGHWDIPLDNYAMDIIDDLSNDEVLADFLAWEGIIGYTNIIMEIVNA